MDFLLHDCFNCLALCLAIMLTGCAGTRTTGSAKGQEVYAQFVVNGMAVGTDFSVVYSMINPNDISSLSVLKGSDASIYGTRGPTG